MIQIRLTPNEALLYVPWKLRIKRMQEALKTLVEEG